MSDVTANRSTTPSPTGVREDEELVQRRTLRDYIIILRERLWVALPIALLVSCGYGYWKSREVAMYQARATIEFQRPETIVTTQGVIDPSIHTKADIFTYIQLLKSGHIFNKVVESFTPDQQKIILRPALRKLLPGQAPPAVGSMMGSMDAQEEGETYIISVNVQHQDPEAAALIANHYVDQFIDEEMMKQSGMDDEAVNLLKASVATLQDQYSLAQQKVNDYIRQHKNLSLDSTTDVVTDELKAVNAQLEKARLDLLQHRNFLQEVQEDQHTGRELLNVAFIANQPTVAPLADQLRQLRAQRSLLAEKYLERHPKMAEIQTKIEITEKQLKKAEDDAVNVLTATVHSEERSTNALEEEYLNRNRDELDLRGLRNQYESMKLEADQAKANLTQLMDRLNQTRTAKMLEKLPIHRLDSAAPNFAPYAPNMQSIIRTSILLGVFSFVGVAVGLSFIDDRIKSAWDIESFIGATLLGIVPDLAALRTEEKYSLMLEGKNSPGVEPFLGIYSALKIHSKLDFPKSVLITSTIPGEGKTLISANMAGTFARHGRKTILVDCDLRRPMLHRHFKQANTAGMITWFEAGANMDGPLLTNPLLGITKLGENFWILTSGGRSKTPTSMLENPVFGQLLERLKKEFDLVVVDSPPMGAVTDALLIAERTDEIVYVCRFNRAYRKHIRLYMRTLANAKHTVLGIVLNGLSPRRIEYYSNYRYYRSYKKYYGTQS